jgi:uncharacterized low-complexity protein
MVDKKKISPLSTALGASFTISLTVSPIVNAADNPFEVTSLSSGYMVADSHEGKCGEGKCGEGKCGDKKDSEGKCGDKKDSEGKCGDKKDSEGKCGSKET